MCALDGFYSAWFCFFKFCCSLWNCNNWVQLSWQSSPFLSAKVKDLSVIHIIIHVALIAFFKIRSGRPDAGRKEVLWAEGQSLCLLEGGRCAKELEWHQWRIGTALPWRQGQLGVWGTGLLEGTETLLFQDIPRSVDTNSTSIWWTSLQWLKKQGRFMVKK